MLWFRALCFFSNIVIAILMAYIITPFSVRFFRKYCCKYLAKCCLLLTGAKLNTYGEDISKIDLANTLVVSNHLSILDVLSVLTIIPVQYIAKIQIAHWYVFNKVVKEAGAIFIDRQKRKDLVLMNTKISDLLSGGATIGLFPEGNPGNGKYVVPFKPALFESAMMAKSKILPIVISYRKGNNELATEVSFIGVSGMQMLLNIFKTKDLVINLTILPVVDSTQFANRVELADYVYKQVNDCYVRQQNNQTS